MIRMGLPGGTYKPITEDGLLMMHLNVLRVIEEVGFQVHSDTGLELFRGAGAKIDDETRLVRLAPEKAMELIEMAPSEIVLCGQDEKHDLHLGGTRVYAGTGGTALNVYRQATGEKRLATLDDLRCIARLVDHLENIHFFLLPTYPNDLPVEQVDLFVLLLDPGQHLTRAPGKNPGNEFTVFKFYCVPGEIFLESGNFPDCGQIPAHPQDIFIARARLFYVVFRLFITDIRRNPVSGKFVL